MNLKRLRVILEQFSERNEIEPPRSEKTEAISAGQDFWQEYDHEHFIKLWLDMGKKTKLLQFFDKLDADKIYPRYSTLVRTGRTSCQDPNIQQIPKSGTFREMFVPRPGHVFLIIDYSAVELRTLAAVCEDRFGYSVLADTIREGKDPHCYVASVLMDISYDKFMDLIGTDPDKYKQRRQSAKVLSFGIPGGLGPTALVQYAKLSYGVIMSEDEATDFRERFLGEVFPEIGEYMVNDLVITLAANLKCKIRTVRRHFPKDSIVGAVKRIVSGKPHKRDGEDYQVGFIDRCWNSLREMNRNRSLKIHLQDEDAGESLERKLFFQTVVAPGGFVRGRTTFTQSRNTPFQSAAATGAKIAAYELFKAKYRTICFVHDEFVIELPENADFEKEAERVDKILCESMQRVTGKVPIETEYAIASCWSKNAELVLDKNGRIRVWEPTEAPSMFKTLVTTKPKIKSNYGRSRDRTSLTEETPVRKKVGRANGKPETELGIIYSRPRVICGDCIEVGEHLLRYPRRFISSITR